MFDWSIGWPAFAAALVGGYILGSIPFGLIITRFAGVGDIRAIGSGNIGATNVLRTGRKSLAAGTLAGDMLKGTVAVILARELGGEAAAVVAGVGAFLGHIFPVWLGFKGGKGVATFLGITLGLAWPAALAFAAIWLAVFWLTRYSSLSALIASAATPLVFWAMGLPDDAVVFAVLAAILWWKHSANIGRLLSGTESKFSSKKKEATGT